MGILKVVFIFVLANTVLLFLFSNAAFALDIGLAWDANSEHDLAGYKLYYKTGSSGSSYNGAGADQGPSPITIPIDTPGFDPDTPQYEITGLSGDESYFFAVTAYSSEGFESTYSNEARLIDYDTVTYNPSMEDGNSVPAHWYTFNNDLDDTTGWIDGVAYSGSHSIMIENTTEDTAGWIGQTVAFTRPYPRTFILGGWARAEDVGPDGIFAIDF